MLVAHAGRTLNRKMRGGRLSAGLTLPAEVDVALDSLLVHEAGDDGLAVDVLPLEAALTLYGLMMVGHLLLALYAGVLGHGDLS